MPKTGRPGVSIWQLLPWIISLLLSLMGFWVRSEVRFTKLEQKVDANEAMRQQLHDFEKAAEEARFKALESRHR